MRQNIHVKHVMLVILALVVAYLVYAVFVYMYSVSEVRRMCAEIIEGHAVSVIDQAVRLRRYVEIDGPHEREGEEAFIIYSSKSVGKGFCTIEFRDEKIISATYFKDIENKNN